jgi:hypothetical protein
MHDAVCSMRVACSCSPTLPLPLSAMSSPAASASSSADAQRTWGAVELGSVQFPRRRLGFAGDTTPAECHWCSLTLLYFLSRVVRRSAARRSKWPMRVAVRQTSSTNAPTPRDRIPKRPCRSQWISQCARTTIIVQRTSLDCAVSDPRSCTFFLRLFVVFCRAASSSIP